MKSIKNISDEEDLEIKVSCVSFFLSYKKVSKLKPLHSALLKELDVNYENELWVILTCVGRALKQGSVCSKFPLNKNNYNQCNNTYGFNISYTKMIKLLDLLIAKDYIILYKGYWTSKRSVTSVIKFTNNFVSRFQGIDLTKYLNDVIKEYDEIIIKDSNTDLPISLRGVDTKSLRNDVINYNKCLKATDIRVLGLKCVISYYRVFNDDINSSGRWYCGSFQTISKKMRNNITFDGEITVELDYDAMHPRINACLLGVILPEDYDPYNINYFKVGCNKQARKLYKQALLCTLYAKSKGEAVSSLAKHIINNKDLYNTLPLLNGVTKTIVDAVVTHNNSIKDKFFNKDSWRELQHIDSEIVRYVVNCFVGKNKSILCYHDSFIVAESDKVLLEDTMKLAWSDILKNQSNVKIK